MSDAEPAKTTRLEIRKYPNRRYYDTTRSRHVTLEELHELIRSGYEVRVTDSRTGEDITAKLLAQIIIDLDPPKLGVFPVAMLHQLLRSNERMVGEFVNRYFNQPLMAFLQSQSNMENYIRQAMGLNSGVPTMADLSKMMLASFNPALWTAQAAAAPGAARPGAAATAGDQAPGEPASEPGKSPDLRSEMDELRRQVAELREALSAAAAPGKTRAKA